MNLSGTPEAVIQMLADMIEEQRQENSALHDRVAAMDGVLRSVSTHLIISGAVTIEKWNDTLNVLSESISGNKAEVKGMSKESVERRIDRVNSEILSYQFDENNPPHLTVIKGGLEG